DFFEGMEDGAGNVFEALSQGGIGSGLHGEVGLIFDGEEILAEGVVEIGGDSATFALLIFEELAGESEASGLLFLEAAAQQMNAQGGPGEQQHQDNDE